MLDEFQLVNQYIYQEQSTYYFDKQLLIHERLFDNAGYRKV